MVDALINVVYAKHILVEQVTLFTILAPDVSMHPEVEFLEIPVANVNRTLGKNSM
jgi:hypothetical protein